MRFEPDDRAVALGDAAHQLLAHEVDSSVIRAGWPGGDRERVRSVWRQLAATGLVGALVPDELGGLGLDEDGLTPMLIEVGRSGLPVPVVETVLVAAPLLGAAGDPAAADVLRDVLAGQVLVGAQLDSGELVAFGQDADFVLVQRADGLWLYGRKELGLAPVSSVDGSRGLARLDRASLGEGGLVLSADPAVLALAWQRGVLGTSALLTGLGERLLELTVDYVKQREQFGVPIGSFQALKHALASAYLALEFARPAVLAAGWAQATGQADAAVRTSMAKVLAGDAARQMARTAIQCHGAIAYTTEYDLHLIAKRIWALVPSWGSPAWHRVQVAAALGLIAEPDRGE